MSLASRAPLQCISDRTNVLGNLALWQIEGQFVDEMQKTRIRSLRDSRPRCGGMPGYSQTGKENPSRTRHRALFSTRHEPASFAYPGGQQERGHHLRNRLDDQRRKYRGRQIRFPASIGLIDAGASHVGGKGVSCWSPGGPPRSARRPDVTLRRSARGDLPLLRRCRTVRSSAPPVRAPWSHIPGTGCAADPLPTFHRSWSKISVRYLLSAS